MHISQEHRLTYKVGFQLVVNENIIAQHLVTAVVRIYLGCNKIGDNEIMFSGTGDKQTFKISKNYINMVSGEKLFMLKRMYILSKFKSPQIAVFSKIYFYYSLLFLDILRKSTQNCN